MEGMKNFAGEINLSGGGNLTTSDFDHSTLFLKIKTTFCIYWTSIKIKTSRACVHKEYEQKIKMVQEQWLQLKMKFLLGYNMKII